ncbi:hypothetical protein [Paenibacillus agricola]|uniref:Uncharacterized protein n=1 Tax=Paenibacillus agricola TaxID=2716264 RepID=A0ABX0J380_9BACL|nr:hypothetical protein [Paenibacillus agricola]NHN28434.1 hypothetical protein [Paenibacillus agricola]
MKNDREKRALERAAVRIMIEIYNRNHDNKLRLLYQQEKPDAVLEDAYRRKIGMEITHLFYDAEEAKRLLGRSIDNIQRLAVIEQLIDVLNLRIQIKESKIQTYSNAYPNSLIIRNLSSSFGMSQILQAKDSLRPPLGKFTNIWFLSRDGSNDWLMKDLNRIWD